MWSIERVVAVLTPLFGVAAGALSTGVGAAIGIPKSDYVALFGFGTTVALGIAWKWLHGRQWFVRFETNVDAITDKVAAAVKADQPASLALADVEGALRSHTDQIVHAIAGAVHAPPSAEAVAEQIIAAAAQRKVVPTEVNPAPAPAAPVPPVTGA